MKTEPGARNDTERLDWMQAHPEFCLRKHKQRWTYAPMTNYPYNTYTTVRDAIDAAIDNSWQD